METSSKNSLALWRARIFDGGRYLIAGLLFAALLAGWVFIQYGSEGMAASVYFLCAAPPAFICGMWMLDRHWYPEVNVSVNERARRFKPVAAVPLLVVASIFATVVAILCDYFQGTLMQVPLNLHLVPKILIPGFIVIFAVPWLIGKWLVPARRYFFLWQDGRRAEWGATSDSQSTDDREEFQRDWESAQGVVGKMRECPANRALAFVSLRHRSIRLRVVNGLLMALIVVVLIGATVFIVFAGEITGRDTQSLDALAKLEASIKESKAELATAKNQGIVDAVAISTFKRSIEGSGLTRQSEGESRESLEAKLQERILMSEVTATAIESASIEVKRKQDLLNELTRRSYSLDSAQSSSDAINLLVATGITRFGVLAVALYLVQILVGLYRYNAQLGGHYDSAGDALMLGGNSGSEFAEFHSRLQPQVSFGRTPATLPQSIIEKLIEVTKSAVERSPSK